jgi:hypothetical protein
MRAPTAADRWRSPASAISLGAAGAAEDQRRKSCATAIKNLAASFCIVVGGPDRRFSTGLSEVELPARGTKGKNRRRKWPPEGQVTGPIGIAYLEYTSRRCSDEGQEEGDNPCLVIVELLTSNRVPLR